MNPTDPIIIRRVRALQAWSEEMRAAKRRIALVPTMGALHTGHLSLVRLARQRAERVAVSIFVNPTQFGPREDLTRYPRDLSGDIQKLRTVGADVVFVPTEADMYPEGNATWVDVDGLGDVLCGGTRPGHFRGVATIVCRLLNAAKPHVAIFGEKDYQQLVIVKRVVRDMMFDVEIVGAPTVREPDGLAMSSRNQYLRADARQQATALNAALHEVRQLHRAGVRDVETMVSEARRRLEREPLAEIEYIEVRDADTLEPRSKIEGRVVVALAVRFEGTRLIDNTVLEEMG
jgi:pantoate--beta-alanine ligase